MTRVAVFLTLLFCFAATAAERLDAHIVRVLGGGLSASGIAVSDQEIATACHTLIQTRVVTLVGKDGKVLGYSWLVSADPVRDICVLHADRPHGLPVPKRGSSRQMEAGELVRAAVFDERGPLVVEGAVVVHMSGARELGVINTDTYVNPGASGGGLFDANGNLVGLVTFVRNDEFGRRKGNYSVPVEWVAETEQRAALPVWMVQPGAEFWVEADK